MHQFTSAFGAKAAMTEAYCVPVPVENEPEGDIGAR